MKIEGIETWWTVHLKRYNFKSVISHRKYPFDHYPTKEEIEECYTDNMRTSPSNFKLSITITQKDIVRFNKDI